VSDRLPGQPSAAPIVQASVSPSPPADAGPERTPLPTAFPRLMQLAGQPPTGTALVLDARGALRELDLSSGRFGRSIAEAATVEAVLGDGRLVLAQRREPWSRREHLLELGFDVLDARKDAGLSSGAARSTSTVTLDGVRPERARRSFRAVSTDVAVHSGGDWVAVAWAVREESGTWHVGLDTLGVDGSGVEGTRLALGSIEDTPDSAYQGAGISIASDGSILAVTSPVVATGRDPVVARGRGWLVTLVDGLPGPSATLELAPVEAGVSCRAPAFVGRERLVEQCFAERADGSEGLVFRPYDFEGRALGAITLPEFPGARQAARLVDDATGSVFVWDSIGPALVRVDVATGTAAVGNHAPREIHRAAWSNRPLVDPDRALVMSADGRRLFALGGRIDEDRRISSTGVWVFDTATLDLVDRWHAPTLLTSATLSPDGRYLLAGAPPEVTAAGELSEYEASVAVFDLESGTAAAVLGRLGRSRSVTLLPSPVTEPTGESP
jgi:hypothetical protein